MAPGAFACRQCREKKKTDNKINKTQTPQNVNSVMFHFGRGGRGNKFCLFLVEKKLLDFLYITRLKKSTLPKNPTDQNNSTNNKLKF